MRILSLIGILLSLIALLIMYFYYEPAFDSSQTIPGDRALMLLSFIFPIYFLAFSIKTALKHGKIIRWEDTE
jgi:hypothetical protein